MFHVVQVQMVTERWKPLWLLMKQSKNIQSMQQLNDNNKPKDIDFGKTIKASYLTGTRTYGDGGNQYQSAAN